MRRTFNVFQGSDAAKNTVNKQKEISDTSNSAKTFQKSADIDQKQDWFEQVSTRDHEKSISNSTFMINDPELRTLEKKSTQKDNKLYDQSTIHQITEMSKTAGSDFVKVGTS